MSCFEYQELISGYLDDELSKEELKILLAHLAECQNCNKNLTDLTLQKEKIFSLRAIHFAPIPSLNFAQNVIEKIAQSNPEPTPQKFSFNIFQFLNWLVFPFKKPLYAGVFSLLILVGVISGVYLENFITHHGQKEFLSIYELQGKKTFPESAQLANLEDEKKTILFHHVTSSSIETLTKEPSLLKYTAYTTTNDHQ
jgi:hypothetical protein